MARLAPKTQNKYKKNKTKLRTSSDVYKRLLWDQTLGFKQESVVIGYNDSKSSKIKEVPLLQWTPIDKGGDIPMHHISYFTLYINDGYKLILWDKINRLDRLFGSGNTSKHETFRNVLAYIMKAQAITNKTDLQQKHNQSFLQKLKTEYNSHCDENICLWMNGSFFPIHKNHIFLLNTARNYLLNHRHIRYNIICAVITITHTNALVKKFNGNKKLAITAMHRIKMCEIAINDMQWIVIDPWLSSQPHNVGASAAKTHLKSLLDLKYGVDKVKIISIIGDDNIFKMKNAIKYGPIMCVLNRDKRKDIESFLQMKEVQLFKHNLIVCEADMKQIPSTCCSSTKIRNIMRKCIHLNDKYLQQTLHANVLKYHQRNHITYREFKEGQNSNANASVERDRAIEIRQNNVKLFKEFRIKPILNMDEFKIDAQSTCGKGIQGEVTKVYWIPRKSTFALKTYTMKKRYSKQCKGYRNELSCLKLLNDAKHGGHNNIIKLFGAGYNETSCFLILELLDISLKEFMMTDFSKWWNSKHIIHVPDYWVIAWSKFTAACCYMNDTGIMHRDLTISNIMIRLNKKDDELFDIVLIDFGTATLAQNANQIHRGSTRHYAPESLGVEYVYNTKSEVFSFGNVLFEFLHKEQSIYHDVIKTCDVWKMIRSQQKPQFQIQCDVHFKTLIESCWEFVPAKRPNFNEIRNTLLGMNK